MRTSWPPTKQAVLSYSLRSAFVWEINFSLRVHIFIRGPTAARGRVVQQEKKKYREGEGVNLGDDIMLLHHLMTSTHTDPSDTNTSREYIASVQPLGKKVTLFEE